MKLAFTFGRMALAICGLAPLFEASQRSPFVRRSIVGSDHMRPGTEVILKELNARDADSESSAVVDHHVHILGPDLLRDWKSLGVPFSRPDSVYLSASGILGESGPKQQSALQQAVLVPMAHLYGNTEFREALDLSLEEEYARVRRENDHVAREAARYAGRSAA